MTRSHGRRGRLLFSCGETHIPQFFKRSRVWLQDTPKKSTNAFDCPRGMYGTTLRQPSDGSAVHKVMDWELRRAVSLHEGLFIPQLGTPDLGRRRQALPRRLRGVVGRRELPAQLALGGVVKWVYGQLYLRQDALRGG